MNSVSNSLLSVFRSSSRVSALNQIPKNASGFMTTRHPLSEKNQRLVAVHQECFNTHRIEERLIEEVGVGQGDPSFNPSPS
ncbi:hypothetical protein DFA_00868 [Cavenderia fasciculata]|uniref:Uncharacterized protein n=1 Tax=Cavenderia fasciculata TaxID=261658 RepID=F4PU73_CACFS|nr:uncharacterized protein DFA_00868 [Cavenderia fasciculata]EGG20999.1 hypothetical protein DFA_00868 [Cavenderia fasciculata]|eukprot:XP_004358849.1 hypothetical protein DFA_00868 [Cavenderia fasciculata]